MRRALLLLMLLTGCALPQIPRTTPTPQRPTLSTPVPTRPPTPGTTPTVPGATATLPAATPIPPGVFVDEPTGVRLDYPVSWMPNTEPYDDELIWLNDPDESVSALLMHRPGATTLEQTVETWRTIASGWYEDLRMTEDTATTLADGRAAWRFSFDATDENGNTTRVLFLITRRRDSAVALLIYGAPAALRARRADIAVLLQGLTLQSPQIAGVPREEALVLLAGETDDARDYDPAIFGGDTLLYAGLVTRNPQLEIVGDLATSWTISADRRIYTFTIDPNARFHDRKPITATAVIFSWERAVSPALASPAAMTYLNDIAGIAAVHDGTASHASGLRAIDDQTLEVTLTQPRATFLEKLVYPVSVVVDEATIDRTPDWFRTPNGSGPYRLARWEPQQAMVYERVEDTGRPLPAIRYIVYRLIDEYGVNLYETGGIDLTYLYSSEIARFRAIDEPLHADLREAGALCTQYVVLDTTRPPFDDVLVRQAFAAAVDRQRYVDITAVGEAIPAQGIYPPGLPGYRETLRGQRFDITRARALLAQSSYPTAAELPALTMTLSGYGSDISNNAGALAQMWRDAFGITINFENIDPAQYDEELVAARHGTMFLRSWCADYRDPENFAEALFGEGEAENYSGYQDPATQALLDAARIAGDPARRLAMMAEAEQRIIDAAPVIVLNHLRSAALVRPAVKGFTLVPVAVPLMRYLRLEYPPDT